MSAMGSEPFQALAEAGERLLTLVAWLWRREEITRADLTVNRRHYRSGAEIGLFLEAEAQVGRVLCWSVEISWAEAWNIESSLRVNINGEESVLEEFPMALAADATEFSARLAAVIDVVQASVENGDLAGLFGRP